MDTISYFCKKGHKMYVNLTGAGLPEGITKQNMATILILNDAQLQVLNNTKFVCSECFGVNKFEEIVNSPNKFYTDNSNDSNEAESYLTDNVIGFERVEYVPGRVEFAADSHGPYLHTPIGNYAGLSEIKDYCNLLKE